MQKTIPQLLAVVRALSDQRFLSYERFREKVTFQKREFAFSWFFLCFSVVSHLTEIAHGSIWDNSEHFGETQSVQAAKTDWE